jgi:hypothetical protein
MPGSPTLIRPQIGRNGRISQNFGVEKARCGHIHCVVPGGGPSLDGTRWVACRPGFFLPVRVLARLFRRLFLRELDNAFGAGMRRPAIPPEAIACSPPRTSPSVQNAAAPCGTLQSCHALATRSPVIRHDAVAGAYRDRNRS